MDKNEKNEIAKTVLNSKPFSSAIPYILFVLASIVLISMISIRIKLPKAAAKAGEATGNLVGIATGSLNAAEYYEEGKAEGKKGTAEFDVCEEIKNVEKLEVLEGKVSIDNFHNVGDKYSAIYLLKGTAVFTVDLSEVTDKSTTDTELILLVPEPVAEVQIEAEDIEKVAEWSKNSIFDGTDQDGIETYINSFNLTLENAPEELANYDDLLEQAEDAAERKIKDLVCSISGGLYTENNIEVKFYD